MTDDQRVQTAGDVAKTGIKALTPPDTGWILAVVLIIGMLQLTEYFGSIRLSEFLHTHQEQNGAIVTKFMDLKADELRRCQETITALAGAVSRSADRAGRAAVDAIDTP